MARGQGRKGRRQAIGLTACLLAVLAVVTVAFATWMAIDCLVWRQGPTVELRVRSSFGRACRYTYAAEYEAEQERAGPMPEVRLLDGSPGDVAIGPGTSALRVGVHVPAGAASGTYAGDIVLRRKGTLGPETIRLPFSFYVRSWFDVWGLAFFVLLVVDAAGIGLPWFFCFSLYARALCWVQYVSTVPGRVRADAEVRRRHGWLWWVLQCSKHHLRFSDHDGAFVDFCFADIVAEGLAAPPAPAQTAAAPEGPAVPAAPGGGADELDALIAGAGAPPQPAAGPTAAPERPAVEPASETGRRELLVVFRNRFFSHFLLVNAGERSFQVARKDVGAAETLAPGERASFYPEDEPTVRYAGCAYELKIVV